MITKIYEPKLIPWTSLIAGYFDAIRDGIAYKIKAIQPSIRRILWVIVGEAIISLSIFLGYILIQFFSHTSYRFVSVFLLIILSSNILAKISAKFIESYND